MQDLFTPAVSDLDAEWDTDAAPEFSQPSDAPPGGRSCGQWVMLKALDQPRLRVTFVPCLRVRCDECWFGGMASERAERYSRAPKFETVRKSRMRDSYILLHPRFTDSFTRYGTRGPRASEEFTWPSLQKHLSRHDVPWAKVPVLGGVGDEYELVLPSSSCDPDRERDTCASLLHLLLSMDRTRRMTTSRHLAKKKKEPEWKRLGLTKSAAKFHDVESTAVKVWRSPDATEALFKTESTIRAYLIGKGIIYDE